MRELIRPVLLTTLVLLIPVLPFLLFGEQMEAWAHQWREQPPALPVTAALVVGLLATDIFLPVPASAVSTLAGSELGGVLGTLASWAGMSAGSVAGFALARKWGHTFALRFTSQQHMSRLKPLSQKYGPFMLVLTRGVPVLAEASVLLMGVHQLTWRRFLPAVLLSNFGLSLAFACFGDFAQQHEWLPLALGISAGLPVLVAAIALRWLPGASSASEASAGEASAGETSASQTSAGEENIATDDQRRDETP